jgi:DNA-binding NarL/FixJ family response regulator
MMQLATLTRLEPLMIGVAAADPVRAADLAARVALAGHMAVDLADAELVLADAESRVSPEFAVLRVGPGAAVPVDLSPTQLDAALRAVSVGLRVSLPIVDLFEEARPLLTPREQEILACLGEGLSNKAVARRLGISAHTVKFHLEAVFSKLGASSRADAVARGLRGGLILL